MAQQVTRSRGGQPHNPEVRELVADKRRFSSPQKRADAELGFRGWHERGYLPHRDEPGLTQFVTFRLVDSFPANLRPEWEPLWQEQDPQRRRACLEDYLDQSRGECHLRIPEIAALVDQSLRYFHPDRYELRAWCIMANHVHVLFKVDAIPMSEIIKSWKRHTALKINRILRRRGAFWADDYFDTYMRNAAHESKTVGYIENNPTKAKLVLDPRLWPWSSARYRDNFGALQLPTINK